MEATVVQQPKPQAEEASKETRIDLHRWQKWVDGDGRIWVIVCLYGYDKSNRYGANVELLDIDNESTIDVPRPEFEGWVRAGTLSRDQRPVIN